MATSFSRPVANRAVHLKITPRPSNLGESREMMRLLSQFGEVEYFKSLKYDALSAPNAALIIYKEESAAQECLKRSPIRFRMGRVSARQQQQSPPREEADPEEKKDIATQTSNAEQRLPRGPIGTPFGLSPTQTRSLSTSSLPTPPPNPIRMPFDPPPPADPPPGLSSSKDDNDDSRLFQILTNTSNRHFRDQINSGHYHGGFAIDSKMPGQEDLAKKVPLLGLSCVDWRAVERPWRVIANERKRLGGNGSLGKLAREGKGERKEVVVEDRKDRREEDVFKAFGVGVGVDDVERGGEIKTSDESFWTFGEETNEKQKVDAGGGEENPLDGVMKGLENLFPGLSPGETPVERYSRKRK